MHLELDYYDVYFPNVFAPNRGGANSRFRISGNQDLSEIRTLDIFDRWGQRVYSGVNELSNDSYGWDGIFQGKLLEQGVYTYISTLEMDDGNLRQFSGTVLLLE